MELLFTVGYYVVALFLAVFSICILDLIIVGIIKLTRIDVAYKFIGKKIKHGVDLSVDHSSKFYRKNYYRKLGTLMMIGNFLMLFKKYLS